MTQLARPAARKPRRLDAFSLPSEPGNERLALARVAGTVKDLGLSEGRLEKLKTAVAEATMNAIEHGNGNRAEIPVEVEVSQDGDEIIVAISDQGGDATSGDATSGDATSGDATSGDATSGDATSGDAKSGDATSGDAKSGDATSGDAKSGDAKAGDASTEEPDLLKKLEGAQSPRGWGLFLIRNMVDAMDITTNGQRHTIWLTMRTGGAAHDEHV